MNHNASLLSQNLITDSGFPVFSQGDDDGIIAECLARIATVAPLSRTFLEIGVDITENNTLTLLVQGFKGVWIDFSANKYDAFLTITGSPLHSQIVMLNEAVTRGSARTLATRTARFLGTTAIDVCSLDIDGNDYHVLPELLDIIQPRLLLVEYNAAFPPPIHAVMAYNPDHVWAGDTFYGASLQSYCELLKTYGYQLVGCNNIGCNAFFIQDRFHHLFANLTPLELFKPAQYDLISTPKGHPKSAKWLAQAASENAFGERVANVVMRDSAPMALIVHGAVDSVVSEAILHGKNWEPFETSLFLDFIKPGDTIIDAGANIGWYSIAALHALGHTGRVLAFEPDETNFRVLSQNVAAHDRRLTVTAERLALSDADGLGTLHLNGTNFGDHRPFCDSDSRSTAPIRTVKLDTYLSYCTLPLPTVLKSDTQGHEAHILRGSSGLFTAGWRPIMFLEFWPYGLRLAGEDPIHFWQTVEALGYRLFEIREPTKGLVALTNHEVREQCSVHADNVHWHINLLCVHPLSTRHANLQPFIQ